ncbi:hypothetical protein ACIBF5_00540 [Micromonospora sp. NPDC050417]|uniref:hypothetical protein n=1 Tax=Micromonospora sp. NPDC050417 TaxID=3364280 RepID=UPI0037B385E7
MTAVRDSRPHGTIMPPQVWPAMLGNARAIVEAHLNEQECGLCPAFRRGKCGRLAWATRMLADPVMLAVERAAESGTRPVTVGDLPAVPDGTVVHLAPRDWSDGRTPQTLTSNVRVLRVHRDRSDPNGTQVWVTGHWLECAWESVPAHPPCAEVLVEAKAILTALVALAGS